MPPTHQILYFSHRKKPNKDKTIRKHHIFKSHANSNNLLLLVYFVIGKVDPCAIPCRKLLIDHNVLFMWAFTDF